MASLTPALIYLAGLGFVTAAVAADKGGRALLWFLYGALVPGLALIHALLMDTPEPVRRQRLADQGYRACPLCAEMTRREATVCRWCGHSVEPVAPTWEP